MSQASKLKSKILLQAERLRHKLYLRQSSYAERLIKAKFDHPNFIKSVYDKQTEFLDKKDEQRVKIVITLTIEIIKEAMESYGLDYPYRNEANKDKSPDC